MVIGAYIFLQLREVGQYLPGTYMWGTLLMECSGLRLCIPLVMYKLHTACSINPIIFIESDTLGTGDR